MLFLLFIHFRFVERSKGFYKLILNIREVHLIVTFLLKIVVQILKIVILGFFILNIFCSSCYIEICLLYEKRLPNILTNIFFPCLSKISWYSLDQSARSKSPGFRVSAAIVYAPLQDFKLRLYVKNWLFYRINLINHLFELVSKYLKRFKIDFSPITAVFMMINNWVNQSKNR